MTKLTEPAGPVKAVSITEARRQLGGLSRSSILRAIERGELRAVKLGKRVLIPVEALDELLAAPTKAADDALVVPERKQAKGREHSERFRKVSTRYPLRVTEAYGRDNLAQAMADSDETVAARVAEWERRQGIPPRDWREIGRRERDESEFDDDEPLPLLADDDGTAR